MSEIILIKKNELVDIVKVALYEYEKKKDEMAPKLYTINQVAKKLHKAHLTIKKLVESGIIKSTKDGLITSNAVNEYLNNE